MLSAYQYQLPGFAQAFSMLLSDSLTAPFSIPGGSYTAPPPRLHAQIYDNLLNINIFCFLGVCSEVCARL
jgi:hypothetical protein